MISFHQDLAWACLPADTRASIKEEYLKISRNPQLDQLDSVYLTAFEKIYGRRNLISEKEPEQILLCPRSRAVDLYTRITNRRKDLGYLFCKILKNLFDTPWLPDNTDLSFIIPIRRKNSGAEFPKPHQEFWISEVNGTVSKRYNTGSEFIKKLISFGNCFHSEEEALQAAAGIRKYLQNFHNQTPEK